MHRTRRFSSILGPALGALALLLAMPCKPSAQAAPAAASAAPRATAARPASVSKPARPAPPPRPQVLFTLPAGSDATAAHRPLFEGWGEAVRAEPRALDDLGLKGAPTPARIRVELARRRLQHWEVKLAVVSMDHHLQKSEPPELVGTAQVSVTLTRLDRRVKAPVTFFATGRFSVQASVTSQREILAVRQAALKAAAAAALAESLTRLFPGK